jgi:hypothetical protein
LQPLQAPALCIPGVVVVVQVHVSVRSVGIQAQIQDVAAPGGVVGGVLHVGRAADGGLHQHLRHVGKVHLLALHAVATRVFHPIYQVCGVVVPLGDECALPAATVYGDSCTYIILNARKKQRIFIE